MACKSVRVCDVNYFNSFRCISKTLIEFISIGYKVKKQSGVPILLDCRHPVYILQVHCLSMVRRCKSGRFTVKTVDKLQR